MTDELKHALENIIECGKKADSIGRHLAEQGEALEFENNKGETFYIPKQTTIQEACKLGVTAIRLFKREQPLEDGWYKLKE